MTASHKLRYWAIVATSCLLLLASSPTASAAQAGADISATPNPVDSGDDPGTTTVRWNTGDGTTGEVYVSQDGGPEQLFGRGAMASQDAPWIGSGHTYEFRLYSGMSHSKQLGSVTVSADPAASDRRTRSAAAVPGGATVSFSSMLFAAAIAFGLLVLAVGIVVVRRRPRVKDAAWAALASSAALASVLMIVGAPVRPLPEQPFPDAQEYADAAYHLLLGHGYVTEADSPNQLLPPRYPPGFSLALVPFAVVGDYPSNIQLGSKLLVVIYLFATMWVAWALGGRLAAALSGAFVGFSPFAATSASLVMSDAFAAAITVLVIGILHRLSRTRAIAGGGLLGALVLLRLGGLAGLLGCLLVMPRRFWAYLLVGAMPLVVALGLYQWSTFGSPLKTGYDYWLPGLRTFDAAFAVRADPQGDGPYIVADRLDGVLLQPICQCPGSNPQAALPNVVFYPAVLIDLFWIFAPPGVGLFGLVYAWSHRRETAFSLILSVALVTLFVQVFYFYQGARFMAGPATLLAISCAVGAAGWAERRLIGRKGVPKHAINTSSSFRRGPAAGADARRSVGTGGV
jgi:hypothetical protein